MFNDPSQKKETERETERFRSEKKIFFFVFFFFGVCGIFVLALKSEFFYEYKIHTKIRFDPIAKC